MMLSRRKAFFGLAAAPAMAVGSVAVVAMPEPARPKLVALPRVKQFDVMSAEWMNDVLARVESAINTLDERAA